MSSLSHRSPFPYCSLCVNLFICLCVSGRRFVLQRTHVRGNADPTRRSGDGHFSGLSAMAAHGTSPLLSALYSSPSPLLSAHRTSTSPLLGGTAGSGTQRSVARPVTAGHYTSSRGLSRATHDSTWTTAVAATPRSARNTMSRERPSSATHERLRQPFVGSSSATERINDSYNRLYTTHQHLDALLRR